MTEIVLHAKSDAAGVLRLEVECPNTEFEVVLRQKTTNGDAQGTDQTIRDLQMTPAEQEEAARLSKLTRDPRWADVGDEDDLLE